MVNFWDTSAIAPLLVTEPASALVRAILKRDVAMLVWWVTPVECLSAIARREREGAFSVGEARQARSLLESLRVAWSEVLPTDPVRDHAARLLLRHPLRAADALQLAAAMTWASGEPRGQGFCTLDERLAEAARGEGFELRLPVEAGS